MKQAILISLKVLAIDVPLLFIIGTALGWILAKKQFKGKELLSLILLLPLALPPSVLGLYTMLFIGNVPVFKHLGLLFTFPAATLAALMPSLPIMIQSSRSGFATVPEVLENAARTLGDGEWKVIKRITFPLCRRHIFAGLALSSARALGDFGVTLMIAGNIPGRTQTLPLYIYSQMEALEFAKANIAAAVLTLLGFTSLVLVRKMEVGKWRI